jgi:hypothetical protein
MWTGRTWGIGRHGLAALAIPLAFGGSCFAGAITVGVSAKDAPFHAASQIVDAWHNIWTLRDDVLGEYVRASGYSANLSPFRFSTCKFEWCASSASAFGDTNSLARTGISMFETPIKWRSSFSIAGSRVWSKVVKFSSNGINVRLPLN